MRPTVMRQPLPVAQRRRRGRRPPRPRQATCSLGRLLPLRRGRPSGNLSTGPRASPTPGLWNSEYATDVAKEEDVLSVRPPDGHRAGAGPGREGAQAVTRAAAVLGALADSPRGELGLTELADRCSLNLSTARRIAAALIEAGLVGQDGVSRRYFLGVGCIRLGAKATHHLGIDSQVIEAMVELSAEVGAGVNLGVLDNGAALYVEKIESPQALGINIPTGTRVPLYCTSIGKVLLAEASAADREVLVAAQSYKSLQVNTITSKERLEAELDAISSQGYAIDDCEFLAGVTCISVPVRRHDVTVAALAIQCPSVHYDRASITVLLPALKATADRVESRLRALGVEGVRDWRSNGNGKDHHRGDRNHQ